MSCLVVNQLEQVFVVIVDFIRVNERLIIFSYAGGCHQLFFRIVWVDTLMELTSSSSASLHSVLEM